MPIPNLTPPAGSEEELRVFKDLQQGFVNQYERVFGDPHLPRTVVVVPSMSFPAEELRKISGVNHYEERMLCLLMLLRMPRTHVIYLSSQPIRSAIIDYYLHLLPGIPAIHAMNRLTLLDCADGSLQPLTEKILNRPRLMDRIRQAIVSPETSHMTCFNATRIERTLAVQLGLPMYNTDPDLVRLGTKSGARALFKAIGVPTPRGFEDLRSEADLIGALSELRAANPGLGRAVAKLDDGFSGEGNAILRYDPDLEPSEVASWVSANIRTGLEFEAAGETYERFVEKISSTAAVVEEFVEGTKKASPSVQYRIDPLGNPVELSSHDQVLGGPSGQVYLGCSFPADQEYRGEIQELSSRVADALSREGVTGRFGVDFVSVKTETGWDHHAIEINLRKGGTTLPNLMLQFLTEGNYHSDSGLYTNDAGQPRFYIASDNVESPAYRGLSPTDLMDIAVYNGIHFDVANQKGVFFHLLGALSEFGKLGMMAIAETPENASDLYERAIAVLDAETTV